MKRHLAKFLYILAEQKKSLIVLFLASLFTSFLEALGIGLVGPFMALAIAPNQIHKTKILNQIYDGLNFQSSTQFIAILGLLIIVIFYIKSGLMFYLKRYLFNFAFQHQCALRLRLLDAYLQLPYTFHLKNNSALLMQNILNETAEFNNKLLNILNSLVNIITLFFLVSLLIFAAPISMLAISITLLTAFAIYYRFRHRLVYWGKEMSKSQSAIIRIVNHSLGGLKETKVFGCQPYFIEQLEEQAKRYADTASSVLTFSLLPRIAVETIVITFLVGLISLSLLFEQDSQKLLSTLSIFGIVAIRLIPAVTQLTSGLGKIRSSSYVIDKLYYDLKELEKLAPALNKSDRDKSPNHLNASVSNKIIKTQSNAQKVCMSFQEKIILEGVHYYYISASEPALNNICLEIKKGQSIALIGKSGAGKTTLVDIILGLLNPQKGDIKVDDRSIYNDLRSWQNLVGYIPQSIFLMDDSVKRNIAYGVPDSLIDEKKLAEAIQTAQLEELIEQLPQGVKTDIGERGVRLSGGQRQRIGIARALYHGREILVLDEATAALDNETEALVTEAIKALGGTKTLIIIAHRLTTVEHCDRIYLMDSGRIVKSGNYREVVLGKSVPIER